MALVNDTSQSIRNPNGAMLATTMTLMQSGWTTMVMKNASSASDALMRVNDSKISDSWATLCVYPGRIFFTVNLRPGEVVTMDGSIWGDSDAYE